MSIDAALKKSIDDAMEQARLNNKSPNAVVYEVAELMQMNALAANTDEIEPKLDVLDQDLGYILSTVGSGFSNNHADLQSADQKLASIDSLTAAQTTAVTQALSSMEGTLDFDLQTLSSQLATMIGLLQQLVDKP